jgi:hypothetical protein
VNILIDRENLFCVAVVVVVFSFSDRIGCCALRTTQLCQFNGFWIVFCEQGVQEEEEGIQSGLNELYH